MTWGVARSGYLRIGIVELGRLAMAAIVERDNAVAGVVKRLHPARIDPVDRDAGRVGIIIPLLELQIDALAWIQPRYVKRRRPEICFRDIRDESIQPCPRATQAGRNIRGAAAGRHARGSRLHARGKGAGVRVRDGDVSGDRDREVILPTTQARAGRGRRNPACTSPAPGAACSSSSRRRAGRRRNRAPSNRRSPHGAARARCRTVRAGALAGPAARRCGLGRGRALGLGARSGREGQLLGLVGKKGLDIKWQRISLRKFYRELPLKVQTEVVLFPINCFIDDNRSE